VIQVHTKRSRGRPRVTDSERKRNNVTIRLRDRLKAALAQSADEQQRSLSEEIERRLETSFVVEEVLGDAEMRRLIFFVTSAFAAATGKRDWLNDPIAYSAGTAAVLDALLIGFPDRGEDRARAIEALVGRLLTRLAHERMEQAR
jgi:hypothetical protein